MFEKCFNSIMANVKDLTREQWRETFERAYKIAARTGKGFDQALLEASKTAEAKIRQDGMKRAMRARQQALVAARIGEHGAKHDGKHSTRGESLVRYIAFWPDLKSGVTSLEEWIEGMMADYQRSFLKALKAVGYDNFGFMENKDGVAKFVRSLFGEDVGDAKMADAARAWHGVNEQLRQRYVDAGGDMDKIERYVPQSHNPERMLDGDKDGSKWAKFIAPLLDRSQYKTLAGDPMDDAQLHEFLLKAWETLVTNGANKERSGVKRGVANRHASSRQLFFADADSWLKYHNEYGASSLFEMMESHLRRMSSDTGILEYLGPNPDGQIRASINAERTRLSAAHDIEGLNKLDAQEKDALLYYNYLAGNLERRPPAASWLGKALDKTFDTLHAISNLLLGSSAITSISDNATIQLTAKVNELNGADVFVKQLRQLDPTDTRYKTWMENSGLTADVYRMQMSRFGAEFARSTWARRVSDYQMRLSLLPAMTRWRKQAFLTVMSNTVGKMTRDLTFDQLVARDHKTMKAYGVDRETWDIWRLAKTREEGFGGTLLDANAIYDIPDVDLFKLGLDPLKVKREAVSKLLGILHSESRMAVVEPGVRERATIAKLSSMPRGFGYLLSAFLQFKTFPIALSTRHLGRALSLPGKQMGAYLGGLVGGMTVMGAVALQANSLLTGRDLRDMNDKKFLVAAWLKGGSLGIFGDFLYGTQNMQGKSALEILAGPIGGLLSDVTNIALHMGHGEYDKAADLAIRLGKQVTPTSSVWYLKAAWDHYVFDQLQEAANPGYLARMQQRAYSRYGTQWWWKPGEAVPDRAPEMSDAP